MTTTCAVCGADAERGSDRTCPVCGADLPVPMDDPADGIEEAAVTDAVVEDAGVEDAGIEDAVASDASEDVAWSPPPGVGFVAPPPPPPPPGWPFPSEWPGPAPRPVYDPTHPSGLANSVRTYAMLTHLSAFAGAVVALAFVGPLVLWLIRREEHPFLDHHGKEALNFNLSLLLYGVIGIVASIATIGIGLIVVLPAVLVFFVMWVVTTIVAAVKASQGEGYRYPLTIRFIPD